MKMILFSLILCLMFYLNCEVLGEQPKKIESKDQLALLEENAIASGDENLYFLLAKYYYYDERCYKKAMYWAVSGAEKGSSDCMLLLRKAYGKGLGVIQDTEESLKWLMLAAATGNQAAKNELRDVEFSHMSLTRLLPDYEMKSVNKKWNEAKKRAKTWADDNPSLFLSRY